MTTERKFINEMLDEFSDPVLYAGNPKGEKDSEYFQISIEKADCFFRQLFFQIRDGKFNHLLSNPK